MCKVVKVSFFLMSFLFLSCNTESSYKYAIKDFRKVLQPGLTKIVSKGIVSSYDSTLRHVATDKELVKLGQSEHPVLRAAAFREMLTRNSFNHFDILMNHLDDTAIVATDAGEWGIWYRSISDDIIEEAEWANQNDKKRTIDEVITKHNYLHSAYTILSKLRPQEKYYPYINDMALRERKSIADYSRPWIGDVEFAVYGLAKFKKTDDVQIIKKILISHAWSMGELSFKLIKEFPDTAYLEVLETYHKRHFYRNLCTDKSSQNAISFIETVASYKSYRSAQILESILNRKPFVNCSVDTLWIKDQLMYAIWDNPCNAYLDLRQQIAGKVHDHKRNTSTLLPEDSIEVLTNTNAKSIRW